MSHRNKFFLVCLVIVTGWSPYPAQGAAANCSQPCDTYQKRIPLSPFPIELSGGPPACIRVDSEGCLVSETYESSEVIEGLKLKRVAYFKTQISDPEVTWGFDGELLISAPDEAAARRFLDQVWDPEKSPEGISFEPLCPIGDPPESNVILVQNIDLDQYFSKLEQKRTSLASFGETEGFVNSLLATATGVKEDTYLPSQLYLEDIGLERAYGEYGKFLPWREVKVAIVDNGVLGDLVDGVPRKVDEVVKSLKDRRSKNPIHGSMMAGIVFSITQNGLRLAGFQQLREDQSVVPNFVPLIFRAFDDSGMGSESDAVKGICWAAEKGAKIILGAWVGEGEKAPGPQRSSNATPRQPFVGLWQALKKVSSMEALWVTAAGNREGPLSDSTYPAAFKKITAGGYANSLLVVGATDGERILAGTTWGEQVDLGAPGRLLYAQNLEGNIANVPAGTSGAAALAAGAAALIYAAHLKDGDVYIDTGSQIRERLIESASTLCGLCPCFQAEQRGLRLNVGNALLQDQAFLDCSQCPLNSYGCSSH